MDYMENGGKGVFFSTHITSDLDKIADMLLSLIHIFKEMGESAKQKSKKTSNSFEFTSFWADGNNKVIADLIDLDVYKRQVKGR